MCLNASAEENMNTCSEQMIHKQPHTRISTLREDCFVPHDVTSVKVQSADRPPFHCNSLCQILFFSRDSSSIHGVQLRMHAWKGLQRNLSLYTVQNFVLHPLTVTHLLTKLIFDAHSHFSPSFLL